MKSKRNHKQDMSRSFNHRFTTSSPHVNQHPFCDIVPDGTVDYLMTLADLQFETVACVAYQMDTEHNLLRLVSEWRLPASSTVRKWIPVNDTCCLTRAIDQHKPTILPRTCKVSLQKTCSKQIHSCLPWSDQTGSTLVVPAGLNGQLLGVLFLRCSAPFSSTSLSLGGEITLGDEARTLTYLLGRQCALTIRRTIAY